jgi:hypothetical protein
MRRELLQGGLLMAALTFTTMAATAQSVVHALTGVVTAVNPQTKTIHINPDDGSQGLFYILTKTDAPLEFQKSLRAASTPAASFTATNNEAIVFYIGDDTIRTAVALQDLGPGPLVKSIGTVIKLDKHAISIKNASGAEETFQIDPKTVADASDGVVEGKKFDVSKGAQVRVIATTSNGVQTAVFIRALTL